MDTENTKVLYEKLSHCRNSTDDKSSCDGDVHEKNSVDTCKAVQKRATDIYDVLNTMASPLSAVLKALRGQTDGKQVVLNKLNLNIDTSNVAKQTSDCDNIINVDHSNIIEGIGPECITALSGTGLKAEDILALKLDLKNISQINNDTLIQNCQINQISDILSKAKASIDNTALLQAVNKVVGVLASSSSDQRICNNLNTSLSGCSYLKQEACCTNELTLSGNNVIKSCGAVVADNVQQKNTTNMYQACSTTNQSAMSEDLASKLINKTSMKMDNYAEGLSSSAIIWICIAVVAVVVGAPVATAYAGGSMLQKNAGLVILGVGILLTMVGIGILVWFIMDQQKEETFLDSPVGTCDKNEVTPPERTTLQSLREKAKSKEFLGFEFFPDKLEGEDFEKTDLTKLAKDRKGLGYLFRKIGQRTPRCANIVKSESRCLTHFKYTDSIVLKIISVSLISVGALITLLGGVLQLRKKVPTPSS